MEDLLENPDTFPAFGNIEHLTQAEYHTGERMLQHVQGDQLAQMVKPHWASLDSAGRVGLRAIVDLGLCLEPARQEYRQYVKSLKKDTVSQCRHQ